MKWLITGAASKAGKSLARILKQNNEEVVGIDLMGNINPAYFNEFYTININDSDKITEIFQNVSPDVAVFLSNFSYHNKSFEIQREVAINGTNNFFKACESLNLNRIVYVSSAIVYGSHPDNPEFLYETDPLKNNDFFPYAKLRSIADILAQKHSEQCSFNTIILRPATVVGKGFIEPTLPFLDFPFFMDFKKDIPLQFISIEDLSYSIYHAVKNQVNGIYNLSAQGLVSTCRLPYFFNKKTISMPIGMASTIGKFLWNLRCIKIPPGSIDYYTNRWTIDASRSWKQIYFPKKSSEEALSNLFEIQTDRANQQ